MDQSARSNFQQQLPTTCCLAVGEQAAAGLQGEEQLGQPGDDQRIRYPSSRVRVSRVLIAIMIFLLKCVGWMRAG